VPAFEAQDRILIILIPHRKSKKAPVCAETFQSTVRADRG